MWNAQVLDDASKLNITLNFSELVAEFSSSKTSHQFQYGKNAIGPSGCIFGGNLAYIPLLYEMITSLQGVYFEGLSFRTTFLAPIEAGLMIDIERHESKTVICKYQDTKKVRSRISHPENPRLIDIGSSDLASDEAWIRGSLVDKHEIGLCYPIDSNLNPIMLLYMIVGVADLAPWWLGQIRFPKSTLVSGNLQLEIKRKPDGNIIYIQDNYFANESLDLRLNYPICLSDENGIFAEGNAILVNIDTSTYKAIPIA